MIRRALYPCLVGLAAACGLEAIPDPPADTIGPDAMGAEAGATDAGPDATVLPDVVAPSLGDATVPTPESGDDESSTAGCHVVGDKTTVLAGTAARVRLEGVTSDGYAIYDVENTVMPDAGVTWTVKAVKLDDIGAGSLTIVDDYTSGAVVVSETTPVVLVWDAKGGACNGTIPCRLRVWSSLLPGAVTPSTNAACWGAASADGTSVMYLGNLNSNATLADLVGASIDGTVSTTLAVDVSLGPGTTPCGPVGVLEKTCAPNFGFVGQDAGQRAIAAFCPPMSTVADILSFGYPFGVGTPEGGVTLSTRSNSNWSTDSSGTQLFVTSRGGTPLLIDTADAGVVPFLGTGAQGALFGESTSGLVTPNGAQVYFVAATRGVEPPCGDAGGLTALWAGDVDGAVDPTPLACGVDDIIASSPNGKITYFNTRVGVDGGTNLYAAQALPNGTGAVTPIATGASTVLVGTTTDRERLVLIVAPRSTPSAPVASGGLVTYSIAGGSKAAVMPNVATNVAMAAGSTAAFVADLEVGSTTPFVDARGDLYWADLGNPNPQPVLLASGAYYLIAVDPQGQNVVFACNSSVYVKKLPH